MINGNYSTSQIPDSNSTWTDVLPTDSLLDINYTTRSIIDQTPVKTEYGSGNFRSNNRYRIRAYRVVDGNFYYSDYVYSEQPGNTIPVKITSNYRASNFTATKGTILDEVTLAWEDHNSSELTGYQVQRRTYGDQQYFLQGIVTKGTETFYDIKAKPGIKYIYELRPVVNNATVNTGDVEATTEIGWSKHQGKIQGMVVQQSSGQGIVGAKIIATASVNNEIVVYRAVTNRKGEYQISDMVVGDSVDYELQVSFRDHRFAVNKQTVRLTNGFPTRTATPFYDLDAYIIKGRVSYRYGGCALDSVKVNYIENYLDGSSSTVNQLYTQNGEYSFGYDPYKANLVSIDIVVEDSTVWVTRPNFDKSYYQFENNEVRVSALEGQAPLVTIIDFYEKSHYTVNVRVKTTCAPIPGENKFSINLRSESGCYNQNIVTNVNGRTSIQLPPINFEAAIVGVSPLSSNNYGYFRQLSTIVNQLNLADEYTAQLNDGDKFADGIIDIDFLYQKEPNIQFTGLTRNCGSLPGQPYILDAEEGNESTLKFAVFEDESGTCHVPNGYLQITNGTMRAGQVSKLEIDPETDKFPDYTFVANNPNPSAPHNRFIIVEYFTQAGEFKKELVIPVVVLGIAPIAGNDIVVNPTENGDVQVPIFVLRDPPGDGSYSYIESGSSITASIGLGKSLTSTSKGGGELTALLGGIGPKYEVHVTRNYTANGDKNATVSFSFKEALSTSASADQHNKNSDGYLIGESADVIAGAGFVSRSGLAWKLAESESGCEIKRIRVEDVDLDSVATTWVYTVDQIEGLIEEYEAKIKDYNKGLYEPEGISIGQIEVLIANWKRVLNYHKVQTLPHYKICSPSAKFGVPQDYQSTFNAGVRNGFCSAIGNYSSTNGNATFTLKDDIVWTDELINEYNAITTMGYNWSLDENYFNDYMKDYDANFLSKPKGFFTELHELDWEAKYGSYAKNITFSGGTSVQEEYTNEYEANNSVEFTESFEVEVFDGRAGESETKFVSPFGGPAITTLKIEGLIGVTSTDSDGSSSSSSSGSGSSSTVGYVLTDDDPGDQYSVFVIKGVDPRSTPYFDVLGGRSSCPYEFAPEVAKAKSDGDLQALANIKTKSRDYYDISLETRDGNGINAIQRHIPPGENAKYTLKLTNNSPFGEARYFAIEQNLNSNGSGATILIQGDWLYHNEYLIPAKSSIYLDVQVKRAQGVYRHDDLQIYMFPACDPNYDGITLNLDCSWTSPCEEVNIVSENNWVLNQTYGNKDILLPIDLGDYDPYNTNLEFVQVEYKRLGTSEWRFIEKVSRQEACYRVREAQTKPAYSSPNKGDLEHL